jgi:hypothetical protein
MTFYLMQTLTVTMPLYSNLYDNYCVHQRVYVFKLKQYAKEFVYSLLLYC